jgi:hypothetical protein
MLVPVVADYAPGDKRERVLLAGLRPFLVFLVHPTLWKGCSRSPISFSGTAWVDKGVLKAPDLFLHRSERPLQLEVLKAHSHIVAFRVGPC